MISYSRYLDIRNAELVRKCVWKPLGKGRVTLEFRRIVSKKRLHSLAQTVKIMPEDTGMDVRIITGINGRMTNSGVQHFSEIEKKSPGWKNPSVYAKDTSISCDSDLQYGLPVFCHRGRKDVLFVS